MTFSRISRPVFALALVGALAACGETADDTGEGEAIEGDAEMISEVAVIEARQTNFEEIGDEFKAIRGQLEGGAPDFVLIEAAANTINTNAQKVPDFFPEGTGIDSGADTEALESIWEKPEDFAAAHQKLVDTSAALAVAAATGEMAAVGEAVKTMGGSCKGCHDNFRLDKD
ncbi:MAG: cytochrome c [Pseudomonadota bacterium]